MKTKILSIMLPILVTIICLSISCEKRDYEEQETHPIKGEIVGYTKCNVVNAGEVIGLFIITEKKDSLLSFNVPLSSIDIDPDMLHYGAHNWGGGSISFNYRIATGKEIKQLLDFICPQDAMLPGFSGGLMENYTQIIVTDIKLDGNIKKHE